MALLVTLFYICRVMFTRYPSRARYLHLLVAGGDVSLKVPKRMCVSFEFLKKFRCDFCSQNRRYLKRDVVGVCGSCSCFVLIDSLRSRCENFVNNVMCG
jgi:hypothetical protein